MASLQERNGSYRITFYWNGKRETFTIGEVGADEADSKARQVDYLLMRLNQRLVALPAGTCIVDFIRYDGNPPPLSVVANDDQTIPAKLKLSELRDRYFATHEASLEPSTVYGMRLHFKHLVGCFGAAFPIAELSLADLQRYVDRRAKANGTNGRKLSAATIRKELVTLRTAWNFAARLKLVAGRLPAEGLRYPKSTEKPPFQTMAEIELQITAGGLTEAEEADLWDALYLTVDEITELLGHVEAKARNDFLYPMFCFAAYTGARRSEIIRTRIADVDFSRKQITIHERKRVKGKATTRRVPLAAFLSGVLKDWLAVHPGGPWLFCHNEYVARSKKRSRTTGHRSAHVRPKTGAGRKAAVRERSRPAASPLTRDEAHDHLRRALKASKWENMRGWHALRHSFVSACASRGVDQRLVEAWAGHMSVEMSRRYAHLWPSVQQEALARVFSSVAK
jgi:integrase